MTLQTTFLNSSYNDDEHQPEKFWAVNENLFITPISVIIADLRRFISLADQVVIIDFNAFPIGESTMLSVDLT